MFKLGDVAPDIAARVAEWERESAEHRSECTADPCDRCGRDSKRDEGRQSVRSIGSDLMTTSRERAIKTIPTAPEFAGMTFDAAWLAILVGPPTLQQAKDSLGAKRAVFVGNPGTGKTSLAIAMFRGAIDAAGSVDVARYRYCSAHSLSKARAGHPMGEGEAPLVEACLSSPLLVLDELGGEDARYASAVAEVLYERHAEGRPTWVTTGVTPKEIAARYGGGIARRVFEGAAVFRLGKR